MNWIASVLPAALLASAALNGAPTPAKALLVLSKGDLTLSIVDPTTLKVVSSSPSGPDPHEVVASSDGKFAYISNYGGGTYNTLTVVDLIAQKTVETIDLGALHGPHGLMYSGGKVWFTAEPNKVIGSYDPSTKKVDWVLGTGQNRTHMIYVSGDQKRMFTTNVNSATVSIIDKSNAPGGRAGRAPGPGRGAPQGEWDQVAITVGRGAEGFDVSPDGKEVWTANATDGTVSVVDVASRKVVQTIPANVNAANRLKFTPDGKRVFVSTLSGPDAVVIDAGSRAVTKRIPIGHGAAGMEMQPDGSRVFVACTPDNYVAIIDLKTLEVTGHLEAGKNPDGLAWSELKR
ncbi:MAG TPA: hypothetical protein VNH18_23085 [Bryobacteraceae bacterium]|nr:hypothetical protein [Bryobacteraceae bacterium]